MIANPAPGSLLTSGGPINILAFAGGTNLNGLWSFNASNLPEPTSVMALAAASGLLLGRRRK